MAVSVWWWGDKKAPIVVNNSRSGIWTMHWRQTCSVIHHPVMPIHQGAGVQCLRDRQQEKRECGCWGQQCEWKRERESEFLISRQSCKESSHNTTRSDEAASALQLRTTQDTAESLQRTPFTNWGYHWPNMMEVVLTRLRDFSCKTSTFDDCKPAGQSACRDSRSRTDCLGEGCTAGDEGRKLDIESALAWLRRELVI